jgi:hypothetical protein
VLPEKPPADSDLLEQYHGLNARFLPLRKVRKSTRLRFLNPAEMVTSASWTADFLESSAMMKVNDGQRRLYITTPHAYLQNGVDKWTWKTLKDLQARDQQGEVRHKIGRNVAIEACWSYNDKLDYVPSLHSSFGSRTSHKSQADSSAPHQVPDQPMSPLSDARPLRQRTISNSLPTYETTALALKRRAASFETLGNAPMSSDPPSLASATAKRARLSISPEAERRGVGFTPRLSREPPSPFHSDVNMVDSRSQGAASKRGTTPFAYATPHSNSTMMGIAGLIGCGDDDTVLGTDLADEEWEGVGDGLDDEEEEEDDQDDDDDDDESVASGENSSYGDTDVDEEEGMTIYEF